MNQGASSVKTIPFDTYQAAREVYNLENVYLLIGDSLEEIMAGIQIEYLDPTSSLTKDNIMHTALVTAFQFAENLADMAASEAVNKRMDWKYALHLPLNHPGISALALCHFRQNMKDSPRAIHQFSLLLNGLASRGLYGRTACGNLEPLEVLFTICKITRYSMLHIAMKNALGLLVSDSPEWLRAHALPHWYAHYTADRAPGLPGAETSVSLMDANTLGADIFTLLDALQCDQLSDLIDRPEIKHLSRLWEEQYRVTDNGVQWRLPGCLHCSSYRQGT